MYLWGPDPISNTVLFKVNGDASAAQQDLQSQYPTMPISVIATNAGAVQPIDNRYYDGSGGRYRGGDRIDTNTAACTDGFTVVGNASGNHFLTTAGHCGGGPVNQDGFQIGSVLTDYQYSADFETISCLYTCTGWVWFDQPSIGTSPGSLHQVNAGRCDCNNGSLVTMDGASSGEQPDFTVSSTSACVTESGHNVCGLHEAKKSGASGCIPGDSGGPVYQRAANNTVYATGSLIAQVGNGSDCIYEPTLKMDNDSNTSILAG
ncbi:MAG: hypothetical protein WAL63_20455 [Solirubrobacteraceae bacterium]